MSENGGAIQSAASMIFITQLIYLLKGQEDIFNQFEDIAIPAILKYNGKLLLRVRPGKSSIVAASLDAPYKIHFVEFATEKDFDNFMQDEERKKYLYLKEQSIKSVIVIKGTLL